MGPISGTLLAVLMYKLIKALEYESLSAEEDTKEVLPKLQSRKPSSVIPLRSVRSGGLEPMSRVSITPVTSEPAKNQLAPANAAKTETKTLTPPRVVTGDQSKNQKSELPECFAD